MRNPLFVRLLNLYLSHRQKVPREDFITEVLAGVLQSDQQLLDNYAHEVLCLPKGEYSLTTSTMLS